MLCHLGRTSAMWFYFIFCFWFGLRKQMYYFELFHVAVIQLPFIYLFALCCFFNLSLSLSPSLISLLNIIFNYFEQQRFDLNAIMMYINDWDWILNSAKCICSQGKKQKKLYTESLKDERSHVSSFQSTSSSFEMMMRKHNNGCKNCTKRFCTIIIETEL